MIGAICGDIVGSIYERHNLKSKKFELFTPFSKFTDDTVLTIATMDALLNGLSYAEAYRKWYWKYPRAGYGKAFMIWAASRDPKPYFSYGNGSAMRVSPVGYWHGNLDDTLAEAEKSAAATHNHAEGIKGAQAVAASIFLARTLRDKDQIRRYVTENFGYRLDENVDNIRTWYSFDSSCQRSVPQAIICFLESTDFEDAVRTAISIGGDSDTIACIAGGIAEAFYGVPDTLKAKTLERLPGEMVEMVERFYSENTNR